MTDQRERSDNSEPRLREDPIDSAEANDPMLATDNADPIDPMDRTEPREPIDRIESCDQRDHFEPEPGSGSIRSSSRWRMTSACPVVEAPPRHRLEAARRVAG
jgi:hypothetical protein